MKVFAIFVSGIIWLCTDISRGETNPPLFDTPGLDGNKIDFFGPDDGLKKLPGLVPGSTPSTVPTEPQAVSPGLKENDTAKVTVKPVAPVIVEPQILPTYSFSSIANDWYDKLEIRAFLTPRSAEATRVLIFLTSDFATPAARFGSPTWHKFAEENNMAILVAGYKYTIKKLKPGEKQLWEKDPQRADSLLWVELKRQISKIFPSANSHLIFGKGQGVTAAARISIGMPKDNLCFIAEDGPWDAVVEKARMLPPALAVNRNKAFTARMLDTHKISRKAGMKLGFVRCIDESTQETDSFLMDFIRTILNPELRQADVHLESEELQNLKLSKDLYPDTAWLPSEKMVDAWRSLHCLTDKERLADVVKETVTTGVESQPELNLYLKMPLASKISPVNGVLCIATWLSSEREMMRVIKEGNIRPDLAKWAEENNIAIVTWNTATLWKSGVNQEDLSRSTAKILDTNFDTVALAWDKGIRRLAMKYHLPQEDYLFFGISRGAHWGHRLVMRRPDRFLAVHFHVANSYEIPTVDAGRVMWLVTTGERDGGYNASFDFYERCRGLNYPIMLKSGANLGHSDSAEIQRLGISFFQYAYSLNQKYRAVPALDRNKAIIPADRMRSEIANMKHFGDFINQGVYSADSESWVPKEQRIFLISDANFLKQWGRIMYDMK